MKFNWNYFQIFIITILFLFLNYYKAKAQHGIVQDDTVLAPEVISPPVIDGRGNDACWQNVKWQPIAQVWIPYGEKVDSADFFGRYKVVWSSSTNLLYFLIEVTDNIFVDGFIPGKTAEVFNYDIVEVFIDEDKSGGLHVFSGKDSVGLIWVPTPRTLFLITSMRRFLKRVMLQQSILQEILPEQTGRMQEE